MNEPIDADRAMARIDIPDPREEIRVPQAPVRRLGRAVAPDGIAIVDGLSHPARSPIFVFAVGRTGVRDGARAAHELDEVLLAYAGDDEALLATLDEATVARAVEGYVRACVAMAPSLQARLSGRFARTYFRAAGVMA